MSVGSSGAEISVEVCNRGTEPVADGVAVQVRDGGQVACSTATPSALFPGGCASVSCVHDGIGADAVTLQVIVDDDGTGAGTHLECREDNNSLTIADVNCP